VAVSFVSVETDAHFCLIEKRNRLALEREHIAGFEPIQLEAPVAQTTGGVKGKRKSKKDRLREAAGMPPTKPATSPAGEVTDPEQHFPFVARDSSPRRFGR
jgi:hypothetical protein